MREKLLKIAKRLRDKALELPDGTLLVVVANEIEAELDASTCAQCGDTDPNHDEEECIRLANEELCAQTMFGFPVRIDSDMPPDQVRFEEHQHCWHVTSRHTSTAGTTVTQKCCHCGTVESNTYPPLPQRVYEYDPSGHGPFAPDTGPMF